MFCLVFQILKYGRPAMGLCSFLFFLNASQFSLVGLHAWYRLKTLPWTLFGESRLHYSLIFASHGPRPYSSEVHGLKLYLTHGNFLSALKWGAFSK
jgi:hypothetical protein